MDNAKYHTRDIKKCCETKLAVVFRSGKEFNGWVSVNGIKAARITVPSGRKPVPRGTYQSMAKQLKIRVSEFDDLLSCKLTREEYELLIQDRQPSV
jgi:hypothetical protein